MSYFENAQQPEAIRATARLPGLDIEIIHRRSPGGDAEQISINLQAVPSFEAVGHFVESATPFVFWARAIQIAWLPWLAAAQAALPPGSVSAAGAGGAVGLCRPPGGSGEHGRRNLSGLGLRAQGAAARERHRWHSSEERIHPALCADE